jgi:hypothetical protein
LLRPVARLEPLHNAYSSSTVWTFFPPNYRQSPQTCRIPFSKFAFPFSSSFVLFAPGMHAFSVPARSTPRPTPRA